MNWLKQALTGADNRTVAFARLVGLAIAVTLLIVLPSIAAGTMISGKVKVGDWGALFEALALYVPPIVGAITLLIWGTNGTEPKPHMQEGQDHG